jgi:predicted Rossmann fold flavoprotein
MTSANYDVVIIGAGAAGMMCAIEAGKRGRRVIVMDHAEAPGEKIRISGGGRCNFTNRHVTPQNFLSQNPHFCKSALTRYTAQDFIKLVDRHGIAWHEKTLGQLFCDGSSRQIIDMLLEEMDHAGVMLSLETSISSVGKTGEGFKINTSHGLIDGASLVIATGGLSIPKMGATGFGYDVAKMFGLGLTPTRAALVPLLFDPETLGLTKSLSGVAVDPARVSCGRTAFDEALLFTHRGLSGPSILQISSYWTENDDIIVDLLPKQNIFEELKNHRQSGNRSLLHNVLSLYVPKRFAELVTNELNIDAPMTDLSDQKLRLMADRLHNWRLRPVGTEGYRTAEVTLGGVDTKELSSKTMEAAKVQGLYFIGEVVDVTGWLGGYNFQWAWSSGWCAGQFA